jgi:hypothetical protein
MARRTIMSATASGMLAALLAAWLAVAAGADTYDYRTDFANRPVQSEPPPNWQYLHYGQATSVYGQLVYRNVDGDEWFDYPAQPPPGYVHTFPYVTEEKFHPGQQAGDNKATVIRFVAPIAGLYELTAAFSRTDPNGQGNGVDVAIFPGGIQNLTFQDDIGQFDSSNAIWHEFISPNSAGTWFYAGPSILYLDQGTALDLAVFNRGSDWSDGTWAEATLVYRVRGDMNCDGVVDFDDINPFVLAISSHAQYQQAYPDCDWYNADCNGDGYIDFGDINPFVAILSRG